MPGAWWTIVCRVVAFCLSCCCCCCWWHARPRPRRVSLAMNNEREGSSAAPCNLSAGRSGQLVSRLCEQARLLPLPRW